MSHQPNTQKKEDYTTWTHAQLLERISTLETQLQQNHLQSPFPPSEITQTTQPKHSKKFHKPPKSPHKPFDTTKYTSRLIAFKFAYLGGAYNGYEHHVNNTTPLPTVEEVLWRALRKARLISPVDPNEAEGEQEKAGKRAGGEGSWTASVGWHPWVGEGREEEVSWSGVEYSKCGRTDRGVSAFGQVVGIRVRSSRPREVEVEVERRDEQVDEGGEGKTEGKEEEREGVFGSQMVDSMDGGDGIEQEQQQLKPPWDPIKDELPYIQLLNRILPPDIRVLAWCPNPPPDFSARFNCRERRYRYFFTNPGYIPLPPSAGPRAKEGWLNLAAMQRAAKKLEGLHDFRNFCKIDASKQITNFERRIFAAGIHRVTAEGSREVDFDERCTSEQLARHDAAPWYFFEVRGSAFLWHQVRHMVGVLFLVGQGHESPSIVDELLDTATNPASPSYEIASDAPLVLWDCIFPDPDKAAAQDHEAQSSNIPMRGYDDALKWIYVGDEEGGRDSGKRTLTNVEDGKYGRHGIMEDLWALWRKRKMDEVLAGSLMASVARMGAGQLSSSSGTAVEKLVNGDSAAVLPKPTDRIFDGGDGPTVVGKYIPLMSRRRKETPEVLNGRYAARKGLEGSARLPKKQIDVDEWDREG